MTTGLRQALNFHMSRGATCANRFDHGFPVLVFASDELLPTDRCVLRRGDRLPKLDHSVGIQLRSLRPPVTKPRHLLNITALVISNPSPLFVPARLPHRTAHVGLLLRHCAGGGESLKRFPRFLHNWPRCSPLVRPPQSTHSYTQSSPSFCLNRFGLCHRPFDRSY